MMTVTHDHHCGCYKMLLTFRNDFMIQLCIYIGIYSGILKATAMILV